MERGADVRKIQKTGRNTFIVSLPKSWADAKGVRPGMAAYVEQKEDGSLRLDVQARPAASVAAVNADSTQALRHVISAYIAGAESIILNGKAATEVADAARRHLAAVDVVGEAPRQVSLRVFATGQEYALSTLLRRLHAVVGALFDAADRAFSNPPGEAAKTAERREDEANRLYTLALRSMGTETGAATRFEALAANALENMADELERFVAEKPKHGRDVLAAVKAAYNQTAAGFFEGRTGEAAIRAQESLQGALDELRVKSALEWARLNDVLRYCVELEDTAADVAAARGLTGEHQIQERPVGMGRVPNRRGNPSAARGREKT